MRHNTIAHFLRPRLSPAASPCTHIRAGLASLVLILLALLVAAPAAGQPFFISSFTPTTGAQGTDVDIFGGGFSLDPDDHFVFVSDFGAGAGVALDGHASTPTEWSGTLGPVATPFAGALTMWKGHRYAQAARIHPGTGAVYWVDRAEWFVARKVAVGPRLFQVTSGSNGTLIGVFGHQTVEFELAGLDFGGDPHRIDLDVVIDGGSSDNNGIGDGRAMGFGLELIEGQLANPEIFAKDLSDALGQSFGELGVKTRAIGTKVRISFVNHPVIRGFAVLSGSGR